MKRDWIVVTIDEGIMRREPTRKAAVEWLMGYVGTGNRVISRVPYGPGDYEYTVGADEEDCSSAFIIRANLIAAQGWDPNQQPLYPVIDDPYKQV